VSGAVAQSASRLVDPAEPLEVTTAAPFVSRGGEKLAAALDGFGIVVAGSSVLDAGASTGGFTDCLRQRGAERIVAVDTGHAQLHERLRADPRVEVHERSDVREVAAELGPVDLVVADLSFISLRSVLDALLAASAPGGPLVLLVKPQFEATRAEADRGRGVIRDPTIWARVLHEVNDALVERGATIMGIMTSPLRGSAGNVEFLLHAQAPGGSTPGIDVDDAIEDLVHDVATPTDAAG
jgi:23S rRNA (cytidine1920-2'-O)/16S rRNA (cytidine1409-2'-O)-methyltransferase